MKILYNKNNEKEMNTLVGFEPCTYGFFAGGVSNN